MRAGQTGRTCGLAGRGDLRRSQHRIAQRARVHPGPRARIRGKRQGSGPARRGDEVMSIDVAEREGAAPRQLQGDEEFDVETDIVIVGGGASGLPAALFSRWLDNDVLLLEK